MKKFLSLFLVLFFVIGIAYVANAQPFGTRKPKIVTVFRGDSIISSIPVTIYSIKIFTINALDSAVLYENTSAVFANVKECAGTPLAGDEIIFDYGSSGAAFSKAYIDVIAAAGADDKLMVRVTADRAL